MNTVNEKSFPIEKVENGITYRFHEETQTYRPYFAGNEEDPVVIGRFGKMREHYLKEHFKGTYTTMLLLNTLTPHLKTIDDQAWERFEQIVKQLAEADGLTEEMKDTDQLKWVGLMNNYRDAAQEMVIKEIIETGI